MTLPLHHQLGFLAAVFCAIILAAAIIAAVREIRHNRRVKRERLNRLFDGVVPHRK